MYKSRIILFSYRWLYSALVLVIVVIILVSRFTFYGGGVGRLVAAACSQAEATRLLLLPGW